MSTLTEELTDSTITGWAFEIAWRVDEGHSRADILSWLMEEKGTSIKLANQFFEAGINYSKEVTTRRKEQLTKRAKVLMLSGVGLIIWALIQVDGAYLFYILAGMVMVFSLRDFRNAGRVRFIQAVSALSKLAIN